MLIITNIITKEHRIMKQKIKYVLASLVLMLGVFFFALQGTNTSSAVSTYECPTLDDIIFME